MLASAYRALVNDQLVNEGPTLVTGYELEVSADGGDATLYDGLDVLSGTKVVTVNALASDHKAVAYQTPVLYNNGLFVDIGSNVTLLTVYFIPLRGNSPLQPYPGFMFNESLIENG